MQLQPLETRETSRITASDQHSCVLHHQIWNPHLSAPKSHSCLRLRIATTAPPAQPGARNRAIVIAESLTRAIAAIRTTSVPLSFSPSTLIFLSLLFSKKQGNHPKKQGFFLAVDPGKEGENAQKSKESPCNEKSKEIQKSKERKNQGKPMNAFCLIVFVVLRFGIARLALIRATFVPRGIGGMACES